MDAHLLLQPWQNFYVAICGAAAAMVALLFVGLSLHLRIVISKPSIRALARQTYTNFVGISVIALVMLMPTHTFLPQAITIGLWSSGNFVQSIMRIWGAFRQPVKGISALHIASRFGGTATAHLGMLVVARMLFLGEADALFGVVFVLIWLLMACVRNAWDLLISVADLVAAHQTVHEPEAAPVRRSA